MEPPKLFVNVRTAQKNRPEAVCTGPPEADSGSVQGVAAVPPGNAGRTAATLTW